MREKRIFIGLSDRFAKPLSSEGFARVDFSGDNHRGGSRSPDHCGDYCSTQKSVHNLGAITEVLRSTAGGSRGLAGTLTDKNAE